MIRSQNKLRLDYIGDGFWRVPETGARVFGFDIPAGFISDLDSVPRIPVFHMILKGRTVEAALLHDYLTDTDIPALQAHKMFLQAMVDEGVKKRYRLPIYWAVRLFWRWHKSRKPP